jgi:hypothetical protein
LLAEGYPTFWNVVKPVSSRVQQSKNNVILLGLLGAEEEDNYDPLEVSETTDPKEHHHIPKDLNRLR